MSTGHRLPHSAHTDQPWRSHDITSDFDLHDVWALPTPGGRDDFPRLVELLAGFDPAASASATTRALFAARQALGSRLGWDDPRAGVGGRVTSLRERLPDDLRTGPTGPGLGDAPFSPLYLTGSEWLLEHANQTVHGLLHVSWVPDSARTCRGQLAILVKPNRALGRVYLAAIAPFRHLIVYPALLQDIASAWRERTAALR